MKRPKRLLLLPFAAVSVLPVPVALAQSEQPASRPLGALSVCEVLKDIEKLDGRIVTVRGTIGWIDRHGVSELAQEGLDPYVQCCPGMPRSKRSWPPALHAASPEKLETDEGRVNFKEERPGISDVGATLRDYKQRTGKDVLIAIITGEIKTRKRVNIKRRGDDIIGNGYGQAGACPGLLVVKRVVAVEDPETHISVPIRFSSGHGR